MRMNCVISVDYLPHLAIIRYQFYTTFISSPICILVRNGIGSCGFDKLLLHPQTEMSFRYDLFKG